MHSFVQKIGRRLQTVVQEVRLMNPVLQRRVALIRRMMLKTDSIQLSRSSPVWNIDAAASVTLSDFDSPSPFSARHLRSCPSVKALSSPVLRKCSNSVIPDDSPAIPRLEPRADNAANAAFGVSPTPTPDM